MLRWNISRLVLYSHHGEKDEITLKPGSVNIITGDSQTGKSAVPEIIDYVMGSSECHIPGHARKCLSWVGLIWVCGQLEIALYRKMPRPSAKSSTEMHVEVGTNLSVRSTADEIPSSTNLDGAMRLFERYLGIGDASSEPFGQSREKKRISVRNVMPYLIQDDDIIISKNTLIRGANDSDKRMGIIDSLPYFLGVVDEESAMGEVELRQFQQQLKRLERELDLATSVGQVTIQAETLLKEAQTVGLCKDGIIPENEQAARQLLERIVDCDILFDDHNEGEEVLPALYSEVRQERQSLSELKQKLRMVQEDSGHLQGFGNSIKRQNAKLNVIEAFRDLKEPSVCPVCNSHLEGATPWLSTIKMTMSDLSEDLELAERQRPRLDAYASEISSSIRETEERIRRLTSQINALVRQDEWSKKVYDLSIQRGMVIGRVSMYLDASKIAEEKSDRRSQLTRSIEYLRNSVAELEKSLNPDIKREALENATLRISSLATDIIKSLPFEDHYRDNPVYLNLRDLKVGVSLPKRVEYMRDVGSDENYLSLHVSVLLALHRYFAEQDRPVPGVIIFDQLSRPYYPPERETSEVEIGTTDQESLLAYFNLLFNEVDLGNSLQVIVLEHAYFKAHKRYRESVAKRWKKGSSGLIPSGWPVLE